MGFDDEGFALQLAMIYSDDWFYEAYEDRPGCWLIGESGRSLEMISMAEEGFQDPDSMWNYYCLEFNDELVDLGLETLRQMLLAELPDAEFFDPHAEFVIRGGPTLAEELFERIEPTL